MSFYRRKLPHWHPAAASIFVTWRLHGSLPSHFWLKLDEQLPGRKFALADRVLDRAQSGPVWLRNPRVAQRVVESLEFGDRSLRHYDLHAWVAMPNHVQVLLSPHVPLPQITKAIKGTTARRANQLLSRTGQRFWQHESFDHWVRDDFEFRKIVRYIETNPVKAGLAQRPEDWPWSSTRRKWLTASSGTNE